MYAKKIKRNSKTTFFHFQKYVFDNVDGYADKIPLYIKSEKQ